MMRRIFLTIFFGSVVGFVAQRQSGAAAGILVGVFSSLSFWVISGQLRSRSLRRQGEIPELVAGEEALLYGPCEVSDAQGKAKAWAYLSNRRLMLRDETGGAPVDIALKDIDELRPDKAGLALVSKSHGLLKLKVPDSKRWLEALRQAVRI